MRFVARLVPEPPGDLTAVPRTPAVLQGRGGERERKENGKKDREGPQCLKCVDASLE